MSLCVQSHLFTSKPGSHGVEPGPGPHASSLLPNTEGWTQQVLTKSRGNAAESSSKGGGSLESESPFKSHLKKSRTIISMEHLSEDFQAISVEALPVRYWELELFWTDGT